ncbi:MAG: hypothetical protein ABJA67_11560, partial [Chthonomonadales bacterium]
GRLWVSAPAMQPTNPAGFRPGQKVTHETFGTGVVLSAKPEAGDTLVSVAFPNHGVKKLMQGVARLKAIN